jgi:hypothetical protein
MQANPRLQALSVLIGEWTTIGAHPMMPGKTLHGRATFTWLESGAFLLFQSHIDEPEIPDGVAILGTDDAKPDAGAMLYFDVRNVSREYRWTISGNVWTWSRDDPAFPSVWCSLLRKTARVSRHKARCRKTAKPGNLTSS